MLILNEKAILEPEDKAVCRDEADQLWNPQKKASLADRQEREAVMLYETSIDCNSAHLDFGRGWSDVCDGAV